MAEGELAAMEIGASLWATSNVANEVGFSITKTIQIGCRYGYRNLKWSPKSPMFDHAGASGLTVRDFQDVILVNQAGQRFWNEVDESYDFFNACLGTNGNLGKEPKINGGGPIRAILTRLQCSAKAGIPSRRTSIGVAGSSARTALRS